MVTQITNENVFCWVLRIPSAVKKNEFPKKYKTGIVRANESTLTALLPIGTTG